jgi:hypothetical protein
LRCRTGTSSNISVLNFPDDLLAALMTFPTTQAFNPAAASNAGGLNSV